VLLPHLSSVAVDIVTDRGAGVIVEARLRAEEAVCPRCGTTSRRMHSWYPGLLRDVPIGGREVW